MEDATLLDKFVTEAEELEEEQSNNRTRQGRRKLAYSDDDDSDGSSPSSPDPESAYLSISSNIRVAIKKHLPLVMSFFR